MRCVLTLRNADAMERAMAALATYRYVTHGEPVAPNGHPTEWSSWVLEIDPAELKAIRDHVLVGDIIDLRPADEPATTQVH